MPPTPTRPRRAGIDALLQPATPSRPSDSSAHYDLAQPWDPTTAMPMPSTPATPNQPLLSLPYDYPPQSNPASADPYHELHFSGWPQALPPPDVLEHLVGLFFKHSSASPIFHGARYRAALANFPSHRSSQLDLAVLHAMIACATPFSTEMFRSAAPENECDPSERGKGKAKASSRSPASQAVAFATFHAERAAEIIEGFRRQYGSTYKLLASSILLSIYYKVSGQVEAEWVETSWTANTSRPLGLNHLPAAYGPSSVTPSNTVLSPPIDFIDANERRNRFWLVYLHDRYLSASTAWPHLLHDQDISTSLPCSKAYFNAATEVAPRSTKITSPDLLLPGRGALEDDSWSLKIKAASVMGQAVDYINRLSRNANNFLTWTAFDPRNSEPFKALAQRIAALQVFVRLHTDNAPDPGPDKTFDPDLFISRLISHVAQIILHDTFATYEVYDGSTSQCLASARAILATTRLYGELGDNIRFVDPFTSTCWTIAARVLIRQWDMSRRQGFGVVEQGTRVEIDLLLSQLWMWGQFFPEGKIQAKSLVALMRTADSPGGLLKSPAHSSLSAALQDPHQLSAPRPAPGPGSDSGGTSRPFDSSNSLRRLALAMDDAVVEEINSRALSY